MRRAACILLLAGCGLSGGSAGGGDNLPASGAGPYGKLKDFELLTPIDEPFLIVDLAADLLDPDVIKTAGGFRVLYTRRSGASEIWRSDLPSLAVPAGAPALALAASEPWENGAVSAPSIVVDGNRLVLFYQGGDSALGRAESDDGGDSWRKTGMIMGDATQPGALLTDGNWRLYFTRPSRPGIFLSTSTDGMTFTATDAPVLEGRPGDVFDTRVGEPAAAGGITAAGELRIALFFAGIAGDGTSAVGFAASLDGMHFVRNPVAILEALAPSERSPGPLLESTHDLLLFSEERAGRFAIAGATAP